MKTAVVVKSGFEYVAVVGFHCDVCGAEEAAYASLLDMVRNETREGEALMVDRDLMAEWYEYLEENAKDRSDWSNIKHMKLMAEFESRNIIRATDEELRVAASMARDVRHDWQ